MPGSLPGQPQKINSSQPELNDNWTKAGVGNCFGSEATLWKRRLTEGCTFLHCIAFNS
jgi:hypothetical protein